jgi:signal transduction histidine kinase
VIQNRSIYQSSQIILNYLIISLVSSTAIFTLMVFLFVEYLVVGRLTRLNRDVQKITASGDTAQRTTPRGKDEIANLGRNINAMLAKLENAQKQLELGYQQVKDGRKRLENLSHRLVDIQEEERRRIAIELHDEIGQSLTGLKLQLATMPTRTSSTQTAEIKKTQVILDDLIERVRRLSLDLRPGMLDDLGLLPALLWYFDQYSSRTGIEIAFHHTGIQKRRFPSPVEIAAYRITQEGLTNIARHAGVKSAVVNVIRRENVIHLEILDEGVGFESEIVSKGSSTAGLSGMRERISMLGGELKVQSKPGKGTKLQVDLPLDTRLERRKNARNHPAG